MTASLPRTEAAIAEWDSHVAAVRQLDRTIDTSALEAYFAHNLAILLCNELQATLKRCVDELIDATQSDERVKSLARPDRYHSPKNAGYKELTAAMSRLGGNHRDLFDAEVRRTIGDAGISLIDNAHVERNKVAHQDNATITYTELRETAKVAVQIIVVARRLMALP